MKPIFAAARPQPANDLSCAAVREIASSIIAGDNMLDLPAMNIRDVVAFMGHLLARNDRDKTPATHCAASSSICSHRATTTNLSLSVRGQALGRGLPRHLSPDEVEAVLARSVNPRRGARDTQC